MPCALVTFQDIMRHYGAQLENNVLSIGLTTEQDPVIISKQLTQRFEARSYNSR